MIDAMDVAKWFVAYSETDESGEAGLTNLKLQKLLYFAQTRYFVLTGTPLFENEMQAWAHGPVIPDVYHSFKSFGSNILNLADDDQFDFDIFDEDTNQFLLEIWDTYGGIAAWKLRDMTHAERDWADRYEPGLRNVTIPLIKRRARQPKVEERS